MAVYQALALLRWMRAFEGADQNVARRIFCDVQARIVVDHAIDAVQKVGGVVASHMGNGELEKVMHSLPCTTQSLFPALA